MEKIKVLEMNKHLPQIILPKEKAKLFIEWYKKDLYDEDNIPEVFNEGYFLVDLNEFIHIKTLNIFELDSKKLAMQNELVEALRKRYDSAVIYFKFIGNGKLKLVVYSGQTEEYIGKADEFDCAIIKRERAIQQMSRIITGNENLFKNVDEDLIIDLQDLKNNVRYNPNEINITTFNGVLSNFGIKWLNTCVYLLISSFWYLASIKDEKEKENLISKNYVENGNRHIHKNKRTYNNRVRNITTPIYDLNKMKPLDVNRLVARKRGWKISCEFSVRGHYRHYKSGKTVFIKPFEKGKGLEIKQNIIRLNPSDNKIRR